MKIGLKWVHVARYGLILRLDGALCHTIISGSLLTQKRAMESSKIHNKVKNLLELAKIVHSSQQPQLEAQSEHGLGSPRLHVG